MRRPITQVGQSVFEWLFTRPAQDNMVALGKLAAAVLGTTTLANGLAVSPTSPASLQVSVAPGEIYSLAALESTVYGTLAADTTHQIVKQGISLDAVLLTITPPATAGQSINYLIQATFAEQDISVDPTTGTTPVVLPFYNSSNPTQPWSGPNNSGQTSNTFRQGAVVLSAKAGIAATTGSQVTPAPDSGNIGLYVVTVANGQSTITAGNISIFAGAPFIPSAGLIVGGIQQNACTSSVAGGTADALTGSFFPGITALPAAGAGLLTLYVRPNSANATTTPTFTPNSGTITAKTIVKGNNLPLAAGDIAGAGHWIELQYDPTLDKWVLLNPATGVSTAVAASIQGAFRNLAVSTTGTNATVSASVDEIVLKSSANAYITRRAASISINTAATGKNGLSTGTLAANTWYAVYEGYDGTSDCGWIDPSATSPTVPSGVTHWARIGWIRSDGTANKYPLFMQQFGRRVQYKVSASANLTALPVMASGALGNITTPTWSAIAVGNFVPSTASSINVIASLGGGSSTMMVAPNNSYGAYNSTTNPPPLVLGQSSTGTPNSTPISMILEGSNIYCASQSASNAIFAFGWEDNL